MKPRPYQQEIHEDIIALLRRGVKKILVQAPCGGGKCLAKGTPVLLESGQIVPVEDVRVGDCLMGPDGLPRLVYALGRGHGPLYRVTPVKGVPYVVNEDHILSLQGAGDLPREPVAVSVMDYLSLSKHARSHCLKGWRSPAIDAFTEPSGKRSVPAYIAGIYLGDGTTGAPAITKPPGLCVVTEWSTWVESVGSTIRGNDSNGTRCPTWHARTARGQINPALEMLRECSLLSRDHIPDAYRLGPIEVRRELLAGLVDSDGSVNNGCVDWISKSQRMAEDFAFVCRSLGLSCYISECRKGIKSSGFVGTYWRCNVSGDLDAIPMRDKPAPPRRQAKRHWVHGITVEPAGEGEWFGFEISGDRLFLLGDFTVTHNTVIASRIMKGASDKGNPVAFLVPRRELAFQSQKTLLRMGVDAGVIMAGEEYQPQKLIQVCSFDTLHARAMRRNVIELPPAKIVIADEAHLALSDTRKEIISSYPDAIHIGLTATPARGDGKPLGDLYDDMVRCWSVRRMMDEGYLCEFRYFGPSAPDMRGVKTRAGDYAEGDLEKVMNQPKLVGDIVANWLRLASHLPTVVFCVTQAHARAVWQDFKAKGVAAEYVDANTPADERAGIFLRIDSGESIVLVNVFVASYGLDIPKLACCVLARPTKSIVLYLQMIGRVARPVYGIAEPETAAGRLAAIANSSKPYAMVIDHTGTVEKLGFFHYDFPWTLHGEAAVQDEADAQRKERGDPKPITCPKCQTVFAGTRFCPGCGHELIPAGKPIPVYEADLQEMDVTGRAANRGESWEQKRQFYAEALGYARERGRAHGWAAHRYMDKYGVWPNDKRVSDAAPAVPGAIIKGFIAHMAIKQKAIERKNAGG